MQHNVKDMKATRSKKKITKTSVTPRSQSIVGPPLRCSQHLRLSTIHQQRLQETIHQRLTSTRLDGDSAEENIPGCKQKDIAELAELRTRKRVTVLCNYRNRIVALDDF